MPAFFFFFFSLSPSGLVSLYVLGLTLNAQFFRFLLAGGTTFSHREISSGRMLCFVASDCNEAEIFARSFF